MHSIILLITLAIATRATPSCEETPGPPGCLLEYYQCNTATIEQECSQGFCIWCGPGNCQDLSCQTLSGGEPIATNCTVTTQQMLTIQKQCRGMSGAGIALLTLFIAVVVVGGSLLLFRFYQHRKANADYHKLATAKSDYENFPEPPL